MANLRMKWNFTEHFIGQNRDESTSFHLKPTVAVLLGNIEIDTTNYKLFFGAI